MPWTVETLNTLVDGEIAALPGRRMVILRVFIKKTQKTPDAELESARKRKKEIEK